MAGRRRVAHGTDDLHRVCVSLAVARCGDIFIWKRLARNNRGVGEGERWSRWSGKERNFWRGLIDYGYFCKKLGKGNGNVMFASTVQPILLLALCRNL